MRNFYNVGKESISESVFDMDELKTRIGKVKGVGESRLNEIMDIIEGYLDEFAENDD